MYSSSLVFAFMAVALRWRLPLLRLVVAVVTVGFLAGHGCGSVDPGGMRSNKISFSRLLELLFVYLGSTAPSSPDPADLAVVGREVRAWCLPLPVAEASSLFARELLGIRLRHDDVTPFDVKPMFEAILSRVKLQHGQAVIVVDSQDWFAASLRLVVHVEVKLMFGSWMPTPIRHPGIDFCLSLVFFTTNLRLSIQPLEPQCTKEALGGLCRHCPVIVFTVFRWKRIRGACLNTFGQLLLFGCSLCIVARRLLPCTNWEFISLNSAAVSSCHRHPDGRSEDYYSSFCTLAVDLALQAACVCSFLYHYHFVLGSLVVATVLQTCNRVYITTSVLWF